MIPLLLALTLCASAPCEHPALSMLPKPQQEAACELLSQPAPQQLDTAGLGRIFERPGFERARQRNTGALQAMWAQLRNWFERLFESSGAEAYSNVTRVFVLALALAIGGGVTLRFFSRRREQVVRTTKPPPSPNALELDDPATHLARAETLLGAAPREAIREALLSLLSSLERRQFARPDRVKTNRELCGELPSRGAPPEVIERVTPLFTWFDRVFYSLDAVPPADARRFLDEVKQLFPSSLARRRGQG